MIRRDYILRELERFAAMLARITGLASNGEWPEANAVTAAEFQALTGLDAAALLRLSSSAVLARLIESPATIPVEFKLCVAITLLKTQGDLLAGQGQVDESREFYLKGLQLLFENSGGRVVEERPDFVPTVESFVLALRDASLPPAMNAMLMRHYEQTGELARAEDALFEIVEAEPENREVLEFGCLFYQRLLGLNDAALVSGNLPRAELQAGLNELAERKARLG